MKRKSVLAILLLSGIIFLAGCKKNSADEIYTPIVNPEIPDLTTAVNSKVYGFITDENGNPINGATVEGGALSVTTDQYGYFRISSSSFPKSAGCIKVTKTGYFNGFRTFIPVEGGEIFFRLQLVPRVISGTVDATAGGTVTTTGGGKLTLPANGVVIASTGAAYSGTVNVAMHWFDPSDEVTSITMPGDLRGIDKDGHLQGLTTFGMLNVELTGSSGELLQVAPNKQASLSIPIPASLLANAPATIPLWYFNETNGLWIEEGSAAKNGNDYEGQVAHFTPWNWDVPTQSVSFTAQIVNNTLAPLPYTAVFVAIQGQPNVSRIFYTDSAGYINNGIAPLNSSLQMSILTPCNGAVVIKTFNTTDNTTPISLGTLLANTSFSEGTFTGSVSNCSGLPVTNGYVLIAGGGYNQVINIQNGVGVFDYTSIICPGANASVLAVDNDLGTQGTPQNIVLAAGSNALGTISACGTPTGETITYSLDGFPATTLALPQHLFNGDFDFANDTTVITAIDLLNGSIIVFNLGFGGAAATGNHNVGHTVKLDTQTYTLQAPTSIDVTTYGLIGEYIIGTISTTILDAGLNPHTFECTISIKRDT